MTRLRPFLLSLFTLLLVGQGLVAATHCLRMAQPRADGLLLHLCTPDGLKLVQLPPDPADGPGQGGEEDGPAGSPDLSGWCLACHATPQLALPAPPLLPAPHWRLADAGLPLPEARAPRPPARAPPALPRAPPAAA
ncbi:DUF2946 family protein [Teichococcus aestuarii]|uniref:DUF2946 family protein n=1 Tax=Teichococcus aestuarii TaxID=568898 RepID=UPI0036224D1E